MFSSNIGFRRRTVSEGYNQLLPPPTCKRTSSTSYRYSLDESSSITVKRIVLRKHSSESAGSRGLADRIARSEDENINGFWSRRISGQRRSIPSSPRQGEPNVAEWRREDRGKAETSSSVAERSQAKSRPRGPRPLSKVSMTSPVQSTSHLIPYGILSPSSMHAPFKITQPSSPVPVDPGLRAETAVSPHLPVPTSQSFAKAKSNSDTDVTDHTRNTGLIYRPLLPPGLPVLKKSENKATVKTKSKNKGAIIGKEKEKRRFAQLELTLSKLVGGRKTVSKQNQSTALTVYSEKQSTALLPPSLPVILPGSVLLPSIPIPPIPDSAASTLPIYGTQAQHVSRPKSIKSVKSSKSSKSTRRKSARKRKTGLTRIVVELAKGEKVIAVDAEAIQEAAEVRDILAQLRQMKAA